jgi:hypothetical protein
MAGLKPASSRRKRALMTSVGLFLSSASAILNEFRLSALDVLMNISLSRLFCGRMLVFSEVGGAEDEGKEGARERERERDKEGERQRERERERKAGEREG